MVYSNTLIEPDKWNEIRKKLYFPVDEDEYSNSSKPLTDLTSEVVKSCPVKKKSLKEGYITDLCRNGGISPCALILGLLYIRRLSSVNPSYLKTVSSSDLFLTAMVIASKYLQDEGETEALVNSEWAEIGQKCKTSLDSLEKDFLQAINWQLYVSMSEYYHFISTVEGRIACIEASRRGWWSYTDLISFWEVSSTPELMISAGTQTTKVVAGSLTLYLVCLTALMSTSPVAMETSTSLSTNDHHIDPYWFESGDKLSVSHISVTPTLMNMDLEMVQDSVFGLGISFLTWNYSHCTHHNMNPNYGTNNSCGRHGNKNVNNDSANILHGKDKIILVPFGTTNYNVTSTGCG